MEEYWDILTAEIARRNPFKSHGLLCEQEHGSGSLHLYREDSLEQLWWATPFWDGSDGICLQESDEEFNEKYYVELRMFKSGDINTDADTWTSIMSDWFSC